MLITKKDIKTLANIQSNACISIFIPTHRSGFNAARVDHLTFKNALGEARIALEERKVQPDEIHRLLRPAYALLDDDMFWSHLSDGLAVFMSPDHFEYFELPVSFNTYLHVGTSYYLRPLLPIFTGDGRFFLLALSQNEVRFFEGTRHSISPVIIEDLVPNDMEEALVSMDDTEGVLQVHSGQNQYGAPLFHGHGSGKDDKNIRLKKFFRQVDKGLMEMLYDEEAPMVVAAVDYLVPLYKEVAKYPYLMDRHIGGNPENYSAVQLHEKAWRQVAPYFKNQQKAAKENFEKAFPKQQASIASRKIIPAAINGRIATLFIDKDINDYWGNYDQATNKVTMHDKRQTDSTCLLNMAAVQTFLQGGTVYNIVDTEMPFAFSPLNATYRF